MQSFIPFSPPDITELEIQAVKEVLESGWITTGPKVKELESGLKKYLDCEEVICLNSATAGLELVLRIWGVGPGDEVIVPAYTYAATANVVLHVGATPIMVDCKPGEFNLDVEDVAVKLTTRTKVVIPVDFGGWPVDYDELYAVLEEKRDLFDPKPGTHQGLLNRVMVMADSAHALGAEYKGERLGSISDFTVFSFHAVKNLTTAEGGAVCISDKLPALDLSREIRLWSLHGQSKDAHSKAEAGNWKYEILVPGYKMNMTDIAAAVGLVQLGRYDKMLAVRKKIYDKYNFLLKDFDKYLLPPFKSALKKNAFHLYPLRIKNAGEERRDKLIQNMTQHQVGVNVHFIPLPLHPLYQGLAFKMEDYPEAYTMYQNEISLPLYSTLESDNCNIIVDTLKRFFQ